ncbi:MAG: hypothetical protein R6X34_21430 [Chloroflexota bacterium]
MSQRIAALAAYFFRSLLFSLTGVIYVILGFAYWAIMFPPGQNTPDASYYILVLAAFGVGLTFLAALSLASRANQAAYVSWIVRLPSRGEYVTAVFLATILFAGLVQLLVAALALYRGPDLTAGQIAVIPPVWLSLNVLTAVLALHATDFVTKGWSRVVLFGILALFLFGQSLSHAASSSSWIIIRLNSLSRAAIGQGWLVLVTPINTFSQWLQNDGSTSLGNFFSLPFWPFHAIADAIVAGSFTETQALAPAILLLYATLLIMLAVDLLATKDLDLTE